VAAVVGERRTECPLEQPLDGDPGYRASISATTPLEPLQVYFAVLNPGKTPELIDGVVQLDLDGDGRAETFRACTSSEGLHLKIWSGAPGTGTQRWHRYLYLGYDVEPSCTRLDFPRDSARQPRDTTFGSATAPVDPTRSAALLSQKAATASSVAAVPGR
jgi:hypothetical protein